MKIVIRPCIGCSQVVTGIRIIEMCTIIRTCCIVITDCGCYRKASEYFRIKITRIFAFPCFKSLLFDAPDLSIWSPADKRNTASGHTCFAILIVLFQLYVSLATDESVADLSSPEPEAPICGSPVSITEYSDELPVLYE